MIYNDSYDIDIKHFGKSIELSPQSFSFSLHDSIYNFFSTSSLSINDTEGSLREYLFFVGGVELDILFSDTENNIQNSFIINNNQMSDNLSSGIINGKNECTLINKYFNSQSILTKKYSGEISTIVNTVINGYPFKEKNIDKTIGSTDWYRLFQTQKDFIFDVLLKNSIDSNGSPFFCFVDSNNCFNFKSWSTMIKSSPIAELTFSQKKQDQFDRNSILSIKPFSSDRTLTKKCDNKDIWFRNTQTGEYEKSNIQAKHILNGTNLNIPVMSNNEICASEDMSFKFTLSGEKEACDARVINSVRDSLFYERFIVTILFNPLIKSGKTVKLNLNYLNNSLAQTDSLYQSGQYLVEDCIHTWDGGGSNSATTTIIVGRKFINVPQFYTAKKRLI